MHPQQSLSPCTAVVDSCADYLFVVQEFVECCDTILPFFDHLGPVFHVARGEFQQKLETLKLQVEQKPFLGDIVEADRKANKATVSSV